MKKLIYILITGLLLTACSKETKETVIIVEVPREDPDQQDPDDTDGDGVKNIIEEIDSTDPNDPCSYLESRQAYIDTSEEWRNLDCDGDGVSNGKEKDPDGNGIIGPNGTNPRMACEYHLADQNYEITTPYYRALDCDYDGVTNGNEIDPDGNNRNDGNGTNPFDDCSLVIDQQTLPPSNQWLEKDCDGDCLSNGLELSIGRDPLTIEPTNGWISEIVEDANEGDFNRKHQFDQEGTRFIGIIDNNNQSSATFTYNGSDQLVTANVFYFGTNINVAFEYTGNLISKVITTRNGVTTNKDIVHDGDTILTYDGGEPTGQFREKFTLDPATGRLLEKEFFYEFNNGWRKDHRYLTYNNDKSNLLAQIDSVRSYDPITGELFMVGPFDEWRKELYEFNDDPSLNPVKSAMNELYFNFILEEQIFSGNWLVDAEKASFNQDMLERWRFITPKTGFKTVYSQGCELGNGFPATGGVGFTSGGGWSLTFIYE